MKKIGSILLCLALLLGLTACGGTDDALRVYVLAGPTGIGALPLWAQSDKGTAALPCTFTLTAAGDEIVAALSSGQADIAAVSTNLAASLYNKTGGGVTVLAVNTAGVLSLLTNGQTLSSITDLKGKTVCSVGQGANPEYILRYILTQNGLDPDKDVTLRFVGDPAELPALWASEPDLVIQAPQPVASSLLMTYPDAAVAFDMSEEWDKVSADSALLMGCLVVRTDFLKQHPDTVEQFLSAYEASVSTAKTDVPGTAALCEQYGLIPKAALAEKAIPACGLTYLTGKEMKAGLSGYLTVMYRADPTSVGGALPGEDFYYEAS